MLDLSSYLGKFNSFKDPAEKRNKVISLIKEASDIELKPQELGLRKGILYVRASSVTKSELFLRKEEILKLLNERLDEKIEDIR